jgi:multicomponent Na+:H+ antiporter subunit G
VTHWVPDVLSWLLLGSGGFFLITGSIGVLRLPDFYSRLHAVGVCDTLGTGLILLGLMVQGGLSLATVKLMLILYFVIFTGPTSIHAMAEAALRGGLRPGDESERRDPSNT